jgi:hypothetical protein
MTTKTALCIGINNYPGTQNDLNGCVNDAHDWANELQKKGFTVRMLLDAKATRNSIIKEMRDILTKTKAGDTVVIQYSGHGSFVPDEDGDEPDGKDECICPHDIVTADGKNNFITDDELFEIYSSKDKDAKLVVISDSCHSGTVARLGPSLSGTIRKVKFLPPSVFLSKEEVEKMGTFSARAFRSGSPAGRYAGLLMAGCQDSQVSFDAEFNGRANGAFSYVALETLKKIEPGETYADWFQLIKQKLPSEDYMQTPNLFGHSSMKNWEVFS